VEVLIDGGRAAAVGARSAVAHLYPEGRSVMATIARRFRGRGGTAVAGAWPPARATCRPAARRWFRHAPVTDQPRGARRRLRRGGSRRSWCSTGRPVPLSAPWSQDSSGSTMPLPRTYGRVHPSVQPW